MFISQSSPAVSKNESKVLAVSPFWPRRVEPVDQGLQDAAVGLDAGGGGVAVAEARAVGSEILADAELAAAVGQLVILALVTLADLVGQRVEDEALLGSDAVVELVEQDGHIGRLADRLRAEDRDVARVERHRRSRADGRGSGDRAESRSACHSWPALERRRAGPSSRDAAESPGGVVLRGRPTTGSAGSSRWSPDPRPP